MATQLDKFRALTLDVVGILIHLSNSSLNISLGIPVDSLPNIK